MLSGNRGKQTVEVEGVGIGNRMRRLEGEVESRTPGPCHSQTGVWTPFWGSGSHGKSLSNEVPWLDLTWVLFNTTIPQWGMDSGGMEVGVTEGRPEIGPLPTSWWQRDDGGLGWGSGGQEGEVMDLRHGFQVKSPGLVMVATAHFWSSNSPFQFFWITVPIHSKPKVETT